MIRLCQQKFNRWAAGILSASGSSRRADHIAGRQPASGAAGSTQSHQIHAVADGVLGHVLPSPAARLARDRMTLAAITTTTSKPTFLSVEATDE